MTTLLRTLIAAQLLCTAALADDEREPADIAGVNTLILEARTNNKNGDNTDDDYLALQNRLNINLSQGDFETQARIDIGLFRAYADVPLHPDIEQVVQIERMKTTYSLGDFELTAGDMYQQLGRGIVLAIRKVNEAGVDIALRGARVKFDGDDASAQIFAGVANPANIDSVNQHYVADPGDIVAGGQFDISATDALRVGVMGAYLQPKDSILDDLDYTVSGGAFVDVHSAVDWLTVYGEAAAQFRMLAGTPDQGVALYGNAELRPGDFAVLFEALWLNGFEQRGSTNTALGNRFQYNVPPTLERIDQEVTNTRDVMGARVRAEYFFPNIDLLLYANGNYRVNEPSEVNEVTTAHAFSGFQWTLPDGLSRLGASAGYRDESSTGGDEVSPIRDMYHVDFDLLYTLGGGFSLHSTTASQFWTFKTKRFDRGSTFIGIERAGLGGLTFELGYDTLNQSAGIDRFFYAGLISWDIPTVLFLDVVNNATFRGTIGTQRGGIKCVAGVCREFPAFSGVRAEIATSF